VATRTEKLTEIMRGLRVSSPDIIGAAIVSLEGFIIASVAPAEIDEELVGGMAAALIGVGERISAELMHAPMEQTYVRSEKGYVILNAVGSEVVLVLLVTSQAKLGLIFLELKRTIPELMRAL
jgi:uncharacterized protein